LSHTIHLTRTMNVIRLLSLLLVIFGLLCFLTTVVHSEEDKIDPDDLDIEGEGEDEPTNRVDVDDAVHPTADNVQDKEEEDPNRTPSASDFQTVHVFIQPAKANELIAGKLTRLLIGTRNNGTQSYLVETIEASLRYPQDFTYYIQNFTSLKPDKIVEPGLETTYDYLFMPSETFNGRPMGLVILVNYRTSEGRRYQNVVFNQTINFIDSDEGFDGETFFLYIFLGGICLLLGFLAYQFFVSWRPRRGGSSKQSSQNLQSNQQAKGNYDIDWIPKHHLIQNRSPKKSPRQRKSRPGTDASEASGTGAASSENDE